MALKSDALWTRTTSERTAEMARADADARRLRLVLNAAWPFGFGGGTLTPSVELGLRHDGGDAETGVEVGAGLGQRGGGTERL